MIAQTMQFNGPRSPEMLAAADRAGRERLGPIMLAHPRMREEFVAHLTLRQPDGTELVILLTQSADGLQLVRDLVTSSELLPGEDAALLPGPDVVEVYEVVALSGAFDQPADARGVRR